MEIRSNNLDLPFPRKFQNQILVFTLDESLYGLLQSTIVRVERAVEITPLPNAPEIVLGVINVQGEIIPVMDVRKRFRLPARELYLTDRFIIVQTLRRHVILVVDSVVGLRKLSDKDMVTTRQTLSFAPYLVGVAKMEDELILIHDLDQFLSLDEERLLDKALDGGVS
jgi:purine-binding chemotaxis protein CheW